VTAPVLASDVLGATGTIPVVFVVWALMDAAGGDFAVIDGQLYKVLGHCCGDPAMTADLFMRLRAVDSTTKETT